MHSNVREMKTVARTLRKEREGILNWWKRGSTNSFLEGLNPVVQQLSGLSGPLFFLVHRAKVQAESSNDQNRNHGKYAIQIERKHIQPDAPFVALNAACQQLCGNQSRDKGTIAANGRKRS